MILKCIYLLQLLFIIFVIFFDYKKPVNTLAWVAFFCVVPLVSIIFYLLFGNRMRLRKERAFRNKKLHDNTLKELVNAQLKLMENDAFSYNDPTISEHQDLLRLNLICGDSIVSQDNRIETFTCGEDKYQRLLEDIKNAQGSIHMIYYIFRKDDIGRKILNTLTEKARQGVDVRLIYDDLGSIRTGKKFFDPLKAAGGKVYAFLPSTFLFNIRINYRNHRKIVVIDGKIGYLGGMNVGDEYASLGKISPWRDTHIRLTGSAVYMLQTRFLMDWAYASKKEPVIDAAFFPPVAEANKGQVCMQIVSSGPDSSEEEIKKAFIKMINSAKKHIYIQSPYFVPDESLLEALQLASLSGVRVTIIRPGKYDTFLVYCGTFSYIKPLLECGVDFYLYDGFIHSKMLIMDDKIVTLGTANIDIRSFTLDFEVNAFIFDSTYTKKMINIFEDDLSHAIYLTSSAYYQRKWYFKLLEPISRLISPLL